MLYKLHPQVKIHYASDKSGVLIFSGFKGQVCQFSAAIISLITALEALPSISYSQYCNLPSELNNAQREEVWHSLINHYILTKSPAE